MIRALIAATAVLIATSTMADNTLTVERMFEAPSLSGPTPRQLKISPDSSRVTFLKASESDVQRGNLWEYSLADNELRLLVDSTELSSGPEQINHVERDRNITIQVILLVWLYMAINMCMSMVMSSPIVVSISLPVP